MILLTVCTISWYQAPYTLILYKERGIKDAAAVKVLTIISLIYLPTAIVAVSVQYIQDEHNRLTCRYQSFFSTQFVQTNANGVMHVSANAWVLAAVSVPLTIVTVATWWLWVNGKVFMLAKRLLSFGEKQPIPDPEKGDSAMQLTHREGEASQGQQMVASRTASSLTAVSCGEDRKI